MQISPPFTLFTPVFVFTVFSPLCSHSPYSPLSSLYFHPCANIFCIFTPLFTLTTLSAHMGEYNSPVRSSSRYDETTDIALSFRPSPIWFCLVLFGTSFWIWYFLYQVFLFFLVLLGAFSSLFGAFSSLFGTSRSPS